MSLGGRAEFVLPWSFHAAVPVSMRVPWREEWTWCCGPHEHAPSSARGVDIVLLCPVVHARRGHVPWRGIDPIVEYPAHGAGQLLVSGRQLKPRGKIG